MRDEPVCLRAVSKRFFFEKKKQKAFVTAVADSPAAYTQGNKSFLVLFFKKEPLSFFGLRQFLTLLT